MSTFRHPQSTPGRNFNNDMSMRMPKPPERPLQPYMRFSRKMWPKVRADNPDVPLWDIGKIISKMWQETTDAERSIYQHDYELEKAEYEKQIKSIQNNGFGSFVTAKGRAKNNEKMSRSRMDTGGVVIQPVDEDDGLNDLSNRKLAGVRFERNNRLITDLFSSTVVSDSRTIVAQHRMDMLRKQAASLAQHQTKLEEELTKLQNMHNERKRSIEKGSDEFQENLKKVVNEKPVIDEEKFQETVKEWEGKLVAAYADYKKKQDEINAKIAENANKAPVLRNLVMDESPKDNEENKETSSEKKESGETEKSVETKQETPKTENNDAEVEKCETTNDETSNEADKKINEEDNKKTEVEEKKQDDPAAETSESAVPDSTTTETAEKDKKEEEEPMEESEKKD